ncbi:hypothetical protein D3C80_440320 [compost metagenome]
MKIYTGVGSRETPSDILALMEDIGFHLAAQGWKLRSGGAQGADQAFENGWWKFRQTQDICYQADDYVCYLPWEGYEDHYRTTHDGKNVIPSMIHFDVEAKAEKMASEIHPAWEACKQGARKMHTRNVFQVLGHTLDQPSKMLIAWTKLSGSGLPKGGTATAIALAKANGIQTFNLNIEADKERIVKWLETLKQ